MPTAPGNLVATAGSGTTIGLSWSAATGATSYNVYRGTSAGGEGTTAYKTGVTGTSFSDTGLSPGSTYYYFVTAVNGAGESGHFSESSATTVAASKLVFGQQPTNATAGVAISPAVTVKVEDASGNVVTSDSSTVTLTLNSGTFASGSSTATATASNGVATFSGLVIDTAGSHTLAASDGSLTNATSNSLAISPAAASQLVITSSRRHGHGRGGLQHPAGRGRGGRLRQHDHRRQHPHGDRRAAGRCKGNHGDGTVRAAWRPSAACPTTRPRR